MCWSVSAPLTIGAMASNAGSFNLYFFIRASKVHKLFW